VSLHNDLLEQALHLAWREPKKPRQASLRRAVSTAYYALFQMLLSEGTLRLIPNKPASLRARVRRAFAHGEMKTVCEMFAKGPNKAVTDLLMGPIEPELREIASTFIDLHEARHKADYDLTEIFDRSRVVAYIDRVEDAMTKWKTVKKNPNANVFLASLLFHSRWNK
jgi:uncharacterized protein (UPF0332 family)